MTTEATGLFSLTEVATLGSSNLHEAKAFKDKRGKEQGDPKYGAKFILAGDHPDIAALKAKIAGEARAKWPGRKISELSLPLQSGDKAADKAKAEGKDREYLRGKWIITSRSKYQPGLGGREGNVDVDYDTEIKRSQSKAKFYPGTDVLAQFNFVAYEGVGNNPPGVTAYLNMVYTFNRGKPLPGTGRSASAAFKGYAGHATAEDPTASAAGGNWEDDDIPF